VKQRNGLRRISRAASDHSILLLLLAVTLIKGVFWSAAIPFGQAPDEFSHFNMIQFIGEFGRLPRVDEVHFSDETIIVMRATRSWAVTYRYASAPFAIDGTTGTSEAQILDIDPALRRSFENGSRSTAHFVPPLYHAIAAVAYQVFYHHDALTRFFATRWVSILMTVLLVAVSYGLARDVFPSQPDMWIT